jgi:actin-like ATPase involved in cell morphogenesis
MSWALGIDLGTSFAAAAVMSNERLEVISLGASSAAVPSAVYRGDGATLVGDAAVARGEANPARLAIEFKRHFGESDPILVGDEFVSAEDLEADLGSWVLGRACEREGGTPSRVTFTFPAYWGAFRRDAFFTLAREITGDETELVLVTEPEAAANFYARNGRLPDGATVGVFDFGGGTFDASVLRSADAGFELLGRPAGDDQLGGLDLDNALLRYVVDKAGINLGDLDNGDPRSVRELARLGRAVTVAKELLSEALSTDVDIVVGDTNRTVRVTRRELEQLADPLISQTIAVFERALAYASITPASLHAVLLVGGSSRMPRVAELLGESWRVPIALDTHPKFAVCLGAAAWSPRPRERQNDHQVSGAAVGMASADHAEVQPAGGAGGASAQPTAADELRPGPATGSPTPAATQVVPVPLGGSTENGPAVVSMTPGTFDPIGNDDKEAPERDEGRSAEPARAQAREVPMPANRFQHVRRSTVIAVAAMIVLAAAVAVVILRSALSSGPTTDAASEPPLVTGVVTTVPDTTLPDATLPVTTVPIITVPTTIPTTIPTTLPTTVPTTVPRTVPTTVPVTTPPTTRSDAIHGKIVWPDGSSVKFAPLALFPIGFAPDLVTPEVHVQTDGSGSYTSRTCAVYDCKNLEAYIDINAGSTFGWGCAFQLRSPAGPPDGFSAEAGQAISWSVPDAGCTEGVGGIPDRYGKTWHDAKTYLDGGGALIPGS